MEMKKRMIQNRKIICFFLLLQILLVFLFGGFVSHQKTEAGHGDVIFTESEIREQAESMAQDLLEKILNSRESVFRADLPQDAGVAWDGKQVDWNVTPFHACGYRELIAVSSLLSQAPISDTENATRQNFTYIVNKNMKKLHQIRAYAAGDGENGMRNCSGAGERDGERSDSEKKMSA